VLASPTEIYGLDVTAFAARRLDVSHRWGVRMKFQRTRVRFPNRNAIPRIETILRIKFQYDRVCFEGEVQLMGKWNKTKKE